MSRRSMALAFVLGVALALPIVLLTVWLLYRPSADAQTCQASLELALTESPAAEVWALKSLPCERLSDDQLADARARAAVRLIRDSEIVP